MSLKGFMLTSNAFASGDGVGKYLTKDGPWSTYIAKGPQACLYCIAAGCGKVAVEKRRLPGWKAPDAKAGKQDRGL